MLGLLSLIRRLGIVTATRSGIARIRAAITKALLLIDAAIFVPNMVLLSQRPLYCNVLLTTIQPLILLLL